MKQLETSIRKATMTCYATEGVYPPTLEYLKKNYNIDMDKILISKNSIHIEKAPVIDKGTGNNSLVLIDAGSNKATVMATLRQITGLGYADAKKVIEFIPTTFMTSISDKEADLTKKALEFVGAKVEIK